MFLACWFFFFVLLALASGNMLMHRGVTHENIKVLFMCSPLFWKLHLLSDYNSSIVVFLLFCFVFQMETTSTNNGTRYYVMAVTPTRLYSFTGIGLLDVSLKWFPPSVNNLSHSASGSVNYAMAHKNNQSAILLL